MLNFTGWVAETACRSDLTHGVGRVMLLFEAQGVVAGIFLVIGCG
jgi:hypothetical protein